MNWENFNRILDENGLKYNRLKNMTDEQQMKEALYLSPKKDKKDDVVEDWLVKYGEIEFQDIELFFNKNGIKNKLGKKINHFLEVWELTYIQQENSFFLTYKVGKRNVPVFLEMARKQKGFLEELIPQIKKEEYNIRSKFEPGWAEKELMKRAKLLTISLDNKLSNSKAHLQLVSSLRKEVELNIHLYKKVEGEVN